MHVEKPYIYIILYYIDNQDLRTLLHELTWLDHDAWKDDLIYDSIKERDAVGETTFPSTARDKERVHGEGCEGEPTILASAWFE
ncbi:hypothetical protein ACJX0J_005690, partial [Zea mays]